MTYQSSEGILLRAIPFRDFDKILTLFTPGGKLNIIKKGGQNDLSPLAHVDFTYFAGKSDLYNCRSLTVINPHLSLRKNLDILEAACEMAKAAGTLAVPNQECSETFRQLLTCLQDLPRAKDPGALACWFYLFLLNAEGLYHTLPPLADFCPDASSRTEIKQLFFSLAF